MSDSIFLNSRFIGERFNGHKIPTHLLSKLNDIWKIILKTTVYLKNKEIPDEKNKINHNYYSKFSLCLTDIKAGSAIAECCLDDFSYEDEKIPQSQQLNLFEDEKKSERTEKIKDIENGTACIFDIIKKINENIDINNGCNALSEDFVTEILKDIEKLPKDLNDDEKIEIHNSKEDRRIIINNRMKNTIECALNKTNSINDNEEIINIYAYVVKYDAERTVFSLKDCMHGSIYNISAETEDFDLFFDMLRQYDKNIKDKMIILKNVSVEKNKIVHYLSVQEADTASVTGIIDSFKDLEDNWLDGCCGSPYSVFELEWMKKHIPLCFFLHLPHVYPTENSGVSFEWEIHHHSISFEVDLKNKTGYWHDLDFETDSYIEKDNIFISDDMRWADWIECELNKVYMLGENDEQ